MTFSFDTIYLLSARDGDQVTLPEITLPDKFDQEVVDGWIERIPSKRLQTITRTKIFRILENANRDSVDGLGSNVGELWGP